MTAVSSTTDQSAYRNAVRVGLIVAAVLGVLTVVEFVIAVTVDEPLLFLLPFVVAKGLLILDYYMHIRRLKGSGVTADVG